MLSREQNNMIVALKNHSIPDSLALKLTNLAHAVRDQQMQRRYCAESPDVESSNLFGSTTTPEAQARSLKRALLNSQDVDDAPSKIEKTTSTNTTATVAATTTTTSATSSTPKQKKARVGDASKKKKDKLCAVFEEKEVEVEEEEKKGTTSEKIKKVVQRLVLTQQSRAELSALNSDVVCGALLRGLQKLAQFRHHEIRLVRTAGLAPMYAVDNILDKFALYGEALQCQFFLDAAADKATCDGIAPNGDRFKVALATAMREHQRSIISNNIVVTIDKRNGGPLESGYVNSSQWPEGFALYTQMIKKGDLRVGKDANGAASVHPTNALGAAAARQLCSVLADSAHKNVNELWGRSTLHRVKADSQSAWGAKSLEAIGAPDAACPILQPLTATDERLKPMLLGRFDAPAAQTELPYYASNGALKCAAGADCAIGDYLITMMVLLKHAVINGTVV
jgi:hypothetical protein